MESVFPENLKIVPSALVRLAGTPIALLLLEESSVEDDGLTCCDELVFGFDFAGEVCVE